MSISALCFGFLSESDVFVATALVHPNGALTRFPSPPRSLRSEIPPSLTLSAVVLTPLIQNGKFPYRQYVKARISLSGNAPLPFGGVALGPPLPNESRLMSTLRLWCYAKCQSCTSYQSSAHQGCNPMAFYLIPVRDVNDNKGFILDQSGGLFTLTSNVTFEIKHRPRNPKAEDQEWRCPSESLM